MGNSSAIGTVGTVPALSPLPHDVRMISAARTLERALIFTLIAHGLAMVGMALLLLPGMPGGPHAAVAARAAYVAAHPWLWRAGWFGWQLTAASDLLLAIALLVTTWVPKVPATLTLLVTLATLVPDQYGQATWTWVGTRLAAHPAKYAPFESHVMQLIAGWGTVGYLAAALGWTWCFAAAGTWSRRLTWLSIATWGLFAIATVGLFSPSPPTWLPIVTSAGNAVAFVLLMVWLISVLVQVRRRTRAVLTLVSGSPRPTAAGSA